MPSVPVQALSRCPDHTNEIAHRRRRDPRSETHLAILSPGSAAPVEDAHGRCSVVWEGRGVDRGVWVVAGSPTSGFPGRWRASRRKLGVCVVLSGDAETKRVKKICAGGKIWERREKKRVKTSVKSKEKNRKGCRRRWLNEVMRTSRYGRDVRSAPGTPSAAVQGLWRQRARRKLKTHVN